MVLSKILRKNNTLQDKKQKNCIALISLNHFAELIAKDNSERLALLMPVFKTR